jgi:acetyl/propionyl-CoA carboxylase alpha subunit
MRYFVTLGDKTHEIVLDGEQLTIDGERMVARIEDIPGTPMQLLTVGDRQEKLYARKGADRGTFDVSLGGFRFALEALDERSRVIRELSGAAAQAKGPAHLTAPMPGLIVRVAVKEGDQVRAGQGLVVMEAMKMENELRAGADAVVKRVVAAPGTAVEKGALLLELE